MLSGLPYGTRVHLAVLVIDRHLEIVLQVVKTSEHLVQASNNLDSVIPVQTIELVAS